MFERWTDIVAAAGGALAVVYLLFEIAGRQQKLRELFNVLDGEDAGLTKDLEELVIAGVLRPFTASGAA